MKKQMSKILLLALASLLMMSLIGCDSDETQAEEIKKMPIEIEKVSVERVEKIFKSTGRITSSNAIRIAPEVRGEIDKIHVAIGDPISKGQLLMSLKSTELESQSELAVKQAQSNYELAIQKYELIEKKYNDLRVLFEAGAISETAIKEMTLEYEQSKNDVALTHKALKSSKVEEDQVNKKFNLVSPIDGRVKELVGVVGERSHEEIAIIIQGDKGYEVSMGVPESIIEEITLESKGRVYIESKDIDVNGYVTKIGQDIEASLGLYKVILKLEDQEALKAGQFVESSIVLESLKEEIMIPTLSIILENNKQYVYVYNNESLEKKEVTIGLYKDKKVQVTSGLNKQDNIVVKGQSFINESSLVEVQ